jgi:hypothetical protein
MCDEIIINDSYAVADLKGSHGGHSTALEKGSHEGGSLPAKYNDQPQHDGDQRRGD